MLKRYMGWQSPVRVVIAGHDFGVVETGDSIPIPDDLVNSVAWPEDLWADGVPPKVETKEESDE